MTAAKRTERELRRIVGDLAVGAYPEYIDGILARTAAARQRPAWTFRERWLPMTDITRQRVLAPRLPLRAGIVALLLVALLLGAVLVAFVGRARPVVPAFGRAANGLVAYETQGDIYTTDPATGVATAIVSGPDDDLGPRFSRDGTHVVFEREAAGGTSQLLVVESDGRDLRLITPAPIVLAPGDSGRAWEMYQFSPDGTSVAIATLTGGDRTITIAQTDGSGTRVLDVGMAASEPTFRPPDGRQILFVGDDGTVNGLFVVDAAGGKPRAIVTMSVNEPLAGASWSPDGSHIAYWSWDQGADGMSAQTHVVAADGSGDRLLPSPAGAVWNAHATWSNDGTRIFIVRGFTPDTSDVRGWVVPADGSGVGTEVSPAGTAETECCGAWSWSPDDSQIIGRSTGLGGTAVRPFIIDVAARTARPAPWTSTSDPSWQRIAP